MAALLGGALIPYAKRRKDDDAVRAFPFLKSIPRATSTATLTRSSALSYAKPIWVASGERAEDEAPS